VEEQLERERVLRVRRRLVPLHENVNNGGATKEGRITSVSSGRELGRQVLFNANGSMDIDDRHYQLEDERS